MTPMRGPNERRRLLAVDDNRLILQVIDDFFTPQGWDALCVTSAREALASLEDETPDAIVSDILMPGMDGWEFLEAVRRRSATAAVPFLFLTIEAELPHRLRGLQLGADDYITKPFAVEELHARIERLLERKAALESARRGASRSCPAPSGSCRSPTSSRSCRSTGATGRSTSSRTRTRAASSSSRGRSSTRSAARSAAPRRSSGCSDGPRRRSASCRGWDPIPSRRSRCPRRRC